MDTNTNTTTSNIFNYLNKTLFEITPFIQVIAMGFLIYLYMFKEKYSNLSISIIFVIEAIVLLNSVVLLFTEEGVNKLWYKINLVFEFFSMIFMIMFFFIKLKK